MMRDLTWRDVARLPAASMSSRLGMARFEPCGLNGQCEPFCRYALETGRYCGMGRRPRLLLIKKRLPTIFIGRHASAPLRLQLR
jgi:hypothetical protein